MRGVVKVIIYILFRYYSMLLIVTYRAQESIGVVLALLLLSAGFIHFSFFHYNGYYLDYSYIIMIKV